MFNFVELLVVVTLDVEIDFLSLLLLSPSLGINGFKFIICYFNFFLNINLLIFLF
jgi:hypothetical protein